MSRGAFGQPTEGAPLDPDDIMALVVDIFRLDKDAIFAWSKERLVSRQAHVQFIFTLLEMCSGVMKATADREYGEDDRFGVLQLSPDASTAQAMFGRLLTATINHDSGTLTALMHTLLDYTERTEDVADIAQIEAELIGLLHFLLNEAASSTPGAKA